VLELTDEENLIFQFLFGAAGHYPRTAARTNALCIIVSALHDAKHISKQ
jgi:hypothetical protein